jgi:MacB-like periplasmic core domain
LCRAPGFTLLAILTLALGIGASTAVFTAVDSIILKPLSYRDSGKLVVAWERVKFLGPNFPYGGPNPRHVDLWQKRSTAFSALTVLQSGATGVGLGKEHPRLIGTIRASPSLLNVLQVRPLIGRGFRAEDGVKGHDNVAILTYGLWQSLFRGDPNVIDKTLRLADTPREVIGVLPPSFRFPSKNTLNSFPSKQAIGTVPDPAIILPAAIDLNDFGWNSDYGNWIALGRLKPGVSVPQAEAQLNTVERPGSAEEEKRSE